MKQDTSVRQSHWQGVYRTRPDTEVSWFEGHPAVSLDLIRATGVNVEARIIDVGGGASRLVDVLLAEGFTSLSVLDIAAGALATAQARLGPHAARVEWIVADITTWRPDRAYDVWHDRAAFHFLTEPDERIAYMARVQKAVRPGGHVIIGTFAPDGPERCSGLPVMRHDAASLGAALGDEFTLIDTRQHAHVTPTGAVQRFQFSRFQRTARPSP